VLAMLVLTQYHENCDVVQAYHPQLFQSAMVSSIT
jgi:hypothetical protein